MAEEDDDDKADPKPTIHFLALTLAAAALRRLSSPPPILKPSFRPLFTILLLSVFIASLTLSSLPRPDHHFHLPSPIFNSTLLTLAQSDPSEHRLLNEIDQLIEGDFVKLSRYRPFLLWRRFFTPDLRPRTSRGLPVATLRSPAFYRLFLQFRSLLSDWSRRRKRPLPDHSVFFSGLQNKYSSCAVIGNSGILLDSNHGASIDSHEAVIRLNNARIQGFADHVGSKTTVSFINSNILHLCARRKDCFCHPYGAAVPLVLYVCQPIHLLDFAACNATTLPAHRAPFLVTDPTFDLLCAKIAKYYSLKRWFAGGGSFQGWDKAHDGMNFHYSSGMQAVLMAAGVCERVSLYGFGKAAAAKHHYHSNQKAELQLHDYEAEYEFYRDLMERPQVIPFLSSIREFQFPPLHIYH